MQVLGVSNPVSLTMDSMDTARLAWGVPEGGFEWRRLVLLRPPMGKPAKRPTEALVPRNPGGRMTTYLPLDEEDLCFEFAKLRPEQKNILAFANKFGSLGTAALFTPSTVRTSELILGDTLDSWRNQIASMATVVDLWEWITARPPRLNRLRECIRWKENSVFYESPGGRWSMIANADRLHPSFFARWRRNDLVSPATFFAVSEINRNLKGEVSPRLSINSEGVLLPHLNPHTLLGALWYQFYWAFIGQRKLRRCTVCKKLMTYIRETKRMHADCGNRLRQARFQKEHRNEGKKKTRRR